MRDLRPALKRAFATFSPLLLLPGPNKANSTHPRNKTRKTYVHTYRYSVWEKSNCESLMRTRSNIKGRLLRINVVTGASFSMSWRPALSPTLLTNKCVRFCCKNIQKTHTNVTYKQTKENRSKKWHKIVTNVDYYSPIACDVIDWRNKSNNSTVQK